MDYQIWFPNLGLYLKHVGKTLTIGGFSIAYYGICVTLGMLLGILAVMRRADETGQSREDYMDIALVTMIVSIVGARLYYVAFSWASYRDNPLSILNLREGGLAIYGGIIGGFLAIHFLSRVKDIPLGRILDTCVIGLPIGQILGRWGNFFNREAFGAYTNNMVAMRLPVSAVRAEEITQEMWEKAVYAEGIRWIQVHPMFFYEGLWNCLVLLILLAMRNKTAFEGELFLLYLLGYGAGRLFLESMRTDQLLLPGTQIPVSMVVSGVAVAVSAFLIVTRHKRAIF